MREEKEITWRYEPRLATLAILKSDNPQAEPEDDDELVGSNATI